MELIIRIGIAVLNVIFSVVKLLPVQKKVVYISRQMNETPLDFVLIKKAMEENYPDCKNVVLAKRIPDGILGKIGYLFHMLEQMYHIATAKVVVLDTYCILVSILKQREELVVIQIWHAIGAFKKFGYSILDKPEGSSAKVANLMRMHHNYTYVFSSSEFAKQYFAEAFNQPMEKMKVFPLPRLDVLLDARIQQDTKTKIYAKYPQLKDSNKKVIVYAPTFRKTKGVLEEGVEKLLNQIDYSKYEIIVKPHPLTKFDQKDARAIYDHEFESSAMFHVADYVLTDYSAIAFEAMLLDKKLFLYAFDYDSYQDGRDFYIDYATYFSGVICKNAKEVIEKIEENDYNHFHMQEQIACMISKCEETYTMDICNFIGKNV